MAELFIEAKNISKQYGDRKVVKDVSLKVAQGEVVGLLGRMELVRRLHFI